MFCAQVQMCCAATQEDAPAPMKLNKERVLNDKSEGELAEEDAQIHGHANEDLLQDDDAEEDGGDAEEEEWVEEGEEEEDKEHDPEEDDENHRTLNPMPTAESLCSAGIESADGLPPEAHEARTAGEPEIRSAPGPDFGFYTGESGFFDEFTVTICRGDNNDKVGLEVATFDQNVAHLQVTKVKPGLIEKWNLANPEKAVKEGDLLVEVNGVIDSATGMLNRIVLDKVAEILVRRQ